MTKPMLMLRPMLIQSLEAHKTNDDESNNDKKVYE